MLKLSQIEGFDWDNYNTTKNWLKHGVLPEECEQVFFDKKNRILRDALHSEKEKRYIVIGKTSSQRMLFIAFTVRSNRIRIISARDIKKNKEIKLYEKKT